MTSNDFLNVSDSNVVYDNNHMSNKRRVSGFINPAWMKRQLFFFFLPMAGEMFAVLFFLEPEKIAKYKTSP